MELFKVESKTKKEFHINYSNEKVKDLNKIKNESPKISRIVGMFMFRKVFKLN